MADEAVKDGGTDKGAATTLANGAATDNTASADKTATTADKTADTATTDKTAADTSDWRARMAGDDKEALKRLSRFTDEQALFKSYRSLEARLSSGEFKKALPEGATPEEIATWRKENGIPENEAGYVEKLALPQGMVLGEADKPIVSEFAKAALESNVDPKQFSGLVAKYYAIQDQQRAARDEADAIFKQESEDQLHQDWQGPEYRQNITAIQNMMAGWPEDLAVDVLAARTPDGKKLGDHPMFVKQLATLARELNPAATLIPAGAADATKGLADELASIRKFRSENPDKYDADKKMQARELELIDADLKLRKRNAA